MSYSVGTVVRTLGAAVGVLLVMLVLADIAGRLAAPASASSPATTRTAARR